MYLKLSELFDTILVLLTSFLSHIYYKSLFEHRGFYEKPQFCFFAFKLSFCMINWNPSGTKY
jgi:hypothetical protein